MAAGAPSRASAAPRSAASGLGARRQLLHRFRVDIVTSDMVVARIRSGNVTVQRYGGPLGQLECCAICPARAMQELHMDQLRLALLGAPQVEVGDAPLRVDTRKAVALLAYLACSSRRHGRDQLAALLWPEGDDAHARGALRRARARAGAGLRELRGAARRGGRAAPWRLPGRLHPAGCP